MVTVYFNIHINIALYGGQVFFILHGISFLFKVLLVTFV